MKFKVVVSTVFALAATLFAGAVAPAQAATPQPVKPKAAVTTPHVPVTPQSAVTPSGSQLSNLQISTGDTAGTDTAFATRLDPVFQADRYTYSGYSAYNTARLWIHATPADPTATVTLLSSRLGETPVTLTSGGNWVGQIRLDTEAITNVTVTVTVGSSTSTYTIVENNEVAPPVRIVSMTPSTGSVLGGETIKLVIAGIPAGNYLNNSSNNYQWLPAQSSGSNGGSANCYINNFTLYSQTGASYGLDGGTPYFDSIDPATGYGVYTFTMPNAQGIDDNGIGANTPGPVDVEVQTKCEAWVSGYWPAEYTSARSNSLYNYVPEDTIDTSAIPTNFTASTNFTLKGVGQTYNANTYAYLYDPATDRNLSLNTWDYTGNDSITYYVSNDPWYRATGTPLQLRIERCWYDQQSDDGGCDSEHPLATKSVTWTNPLPQNVTITPAFAGVNCQKDGSYCTQEFKLKGRFLDMDNDPYVLINGQSINITERVWTAYSDQSSFKEYTAGTDVYKIQVPVSAVSGKFDVKVYNDFSDNENDYTLARTKFIYGDTPVITSVAPASVSKLGGSQITLVGKNFGQTGTPIVTIGGEKSPYVVRLNDTKVIAVVPASANAGAADVQILSSNGGGAALQAGTLTYTNSAVAPAVTSISPASSVLAGGGAATITGTGFATGNANGVLVDGKFAKVTASTATTITFEVPDGDSLGAKAVKVSTPTGVVTKSSALTYVVPAGISSLTPNSIRSYATGADAKIVVNGSAFGAAGTVKVGAQAAQPYSTTAAVRVNSAGTAISNVVVDLSTMGAGAQSVVVTPTGGKAFSASLTVTGPDLSYVGSVDPSTHSYNGSNTDWYSNGNIDTGDSGLPYAAQTVSDVVKLQGSGFGPTPGGSVLLNTKPTATVISGSNIVSWSDTEIQFTVPNGTASGLYDVTVAPVHGLATATQTQRLQVMPRLKSPVFISAVGKAMRVDGNGVEVSSGGTLLNPNNIDASYVYDTSVPNSPKFTINGQNFLGSDAGAGTKVYLYSQYSYGTAENVAYNNYSYLWDVTPSAITDTSMDIVLPKELRNMPDDQWLWLGIVTNDGNTETYYGINYYGTGNYPPNVSYSSNLLKFVSGTTYTNASQGEGFCGGSGTAATNAAAAGYPKYGFDATTDGTDADSFGTAPYYVTVKNGDGTGTDSPRSLGQRPNPGVRNSTEVDSVFSMAALGTLDDYSDKTLKIVGTGNTGKTYSISCKLLPTAITTKVALNSATPVDTATVTVGVDQITADTAHTLFNFGYTIPNGTSGTRGFVSTYPFTLQGSSVNAATATDTQVTDYNNYEYVSAIARDRNQWSIDHSLTAWHQGVPQHKGSYYVRLRLSGAFSTDVYSIPDTNPVKVIVTAPNLHLTITRNAAAEFIYKGATTASGPNTSTDSFTWGTQESLPTGDSAITAVNYVYRDVNCATASGNWWRSGLPKGVTYGSGSACGDLATDVVTYEVRIASVEMKSSGANIAGTDWNIFTGDSVQIKINPRPVSVTLAASSKYYDGNTTAALNLSDVMAISGNADSGVITGDVVAIKGGTTGTYSQANAGKDLTVSYDNPLALSNKNYYISPDPGALTGTIKPSTAVMAATPASLTIMCPNNTCDSSNTDAITVANTDLYSGRDVSGETSGSATDSIGVLTYTSKTGGKCSVDAATGVVTPIAPGLCTIAVSQPAAANFTASRSAADPTSKEELINITIIGAPKTPGVIVDDLVLSTTDMGSFSLTDPTVQFSDLLPGDSIDGYTFTLWNGSTPVTSGFDALAVGTYTIKVEGAVMHADTSGDAAYTGQFRYVSGKLFVTAVPPAITQISPQVGPEAGGTSVTITGTNLAGVTSVVIGDVTIREPQFTVNDAGTAITFVTPAGYATQDLTLVAGKAETTDSFTYVPPANPVSTVKSIAPKTDIVDGGALVTLTGTHLDQVQSINFCGTVLYSSDFTVNSDGSGITLFAPSHGATKSCAITVVAPGTDPTATFGYFDPAAPNAPLNLDLNLNVDLGSALSGSQADLVGGGLQPATSYTLEMHSKTVLVYKGKTNSAGNFKQKITMPQKACVDGGKHKLILTGISPAGKKVTSIQYLALTDTCIVLAKSKKPIKTITSLGVGGFLFDYNSAKLTKKAKASLNSIAAALVGAKTITLTGFTQTDLKSKASKIANKDLAKRRAIAVRDYLKGLGLKSAKYVIVAKGATEPVSTKNQKLNRRVNIDAKFLNKKMLIG